jgi:hypothetical protein
MVCTTKLTLVLAELIHHLSDPSRDSSKDEDARHFLGFRHDGNAKNTVWTDGRVLCCAELCCAVIVVNARIPLRGTVETSCLCVCMPVL